MKVVVIMLSESFDYGLNQPILILPRILLSGW